MIYKTRVLIRLRIGPKAHLQHNSRISLFIFIFEKNGFDQTCRLFLVYLLHVHKHPNFHSRTQSFESRLQYAVDDQKNATVQNGSPKPRRVSDLSQQNIRHNSLACVRETRSSTILSVACTTYMAHNSIITSFSVFV